MGLFVLLGFVCVALGDALVRNGDDGSWPTLIKYKSKTLNPAYQYHDSNIASLITVPAYRFFPSVQGALEWLVSENMAEEDIYGVYQLHPVKIERVQAGTRRVTRNVVTIKEVEEPVFDWIRPQQE